MPRPMRHRRIAGQPVATVFKPAGIPARQLDWIRLGLDEFEALRLVDWEGLDQETVAERMGVSRPTVTRILGAARTKIAKALTHGQAILIEGGPVLQVPGPPCGRGRGRRRGSGRGRRGFPENEAL